MGDGQLTDIPVKNVYSGVVSICGIHLIILLTDTNELEMWATYIGNEHIEAKTLDKV